MATVGQIYAVLKLKGGNEFVKDFKSVSHRLKSDIKENKMELAKLGVQLSAIVYGSKKLVDTFAEVDRGVREITTLLGNVTRQQFRALRKDLEDTAIRFGQTFGAMAKARYDIISAGFTEIADSAKVLAVAAKLAVAGVSDVSKTALATTKILNAFGLGIKYAVPVADMLFTTVAKGQTTINELVSQIGQLAPTARAAKIGMDGMGASMAVVTAGGLDTANGTVALRGALDAIVAPMGNYRKIMQDAGISVYRFKDGMMDLVKTFKQFEGMDLDEIKKFIPEDRAANAVMIMSNNIDKLSGALDAMAMKAGMNEEAFNKMSQGISYRLNQAKERFHKALTSMGESLYPLYNLGVSFLEMLTKIPDSIQMVITNVAAITSVLLILRKALLLLSVSMGPTGWLITGVGLAASAFILFKTGAKESAEELSKFRKEIISLKTAELENKLISLKQRIADLKEEYDKKGKSNDWWLQKKVIQGKIAKEIAALENKSKVLEGLLASRKKGESEAEAAEKEKALEAEKEYRQTLQNLQFEHNEISLRQYVAYLRKRQKEFKKNSTDFLNLKYKIIDLEKEADSKRLDDSLSLKEKEYRRNKITLSEYIQYLKERRDAYVKNSDAYIRINDRVEELQKQSAANHAAFLKAQQDLDYNQGRTSLDTYLQILQERLDKTEKFSSEYTQIWSRMSALIAQKTKADADKLKADWRSAAAAMKTTGENIGSIIADKLTSGADKWKEVGKQMLLGLVDILEAKLVAAEVSALIDSIVNWATFAKNAPLIAAAHTGMAALRGAIMAMAEGGVVTQPTLAIIGERKVAGSYMPEVVAPQDKFEDFAKKLMMDVTGSPSTGSGFGSGDVKVIQNFNTPLQDKRMARKLTDEVYIPEVRRNMKRQGRFINKDPLR